jgi:hypothetical protein
MTETPLRNRLEKVFLALRTDYFGVEDEHMTLKYFNSVNFAGLIHIASELSPYVPTALKLNGFANYQTNGVHYEVAMVDFFDNPHLYQYTRFPHITIRKSDKPLSCATFVPEIYGTEIKIIDTIYLGKKIKGKIVWMPVDSRSLHTLKNQWIEKAGDCFVEKR